MVALYIVFFFVTLFSSVTETLGYYEDREMLEDILDHIMSMKSDMDQMNDKLDQLIGEVEVPSNLPSVCHQYSELSDSWRHINYVKRTGGSGTYHCDMPLPASPLGSPSRYSNLTVAWYRFTGAAGSKLPTAPAPVGGGPGYSRNNQICKTSSVAYISPGGNPSIQDGIVTRDVCFEHGDNRCYHNTTVEVAACRDIHGDYFVYKLQPVPACSSAYCALD